MIRPLYNYLILPITYLGFRVLARFDKKAEKTLQARRGLFSALKENLGALDAQRARMLIHVSSVGEYLQAVPLIKSLKQAPDKPQVVLSFMSPSLAGQLEKIPAADFNTYLPLDFAKNAAGFLELIKPSLVIFSSYDVWPNLLFAAKDRKIPVVLVNATLASTSGRLLPVARLFFGSLYSQIDRIGAISEEDAERFRSLGLKNVEVTGNCRFDQTLARCLAVDANDPLLTALPQWRTTLVAGSTWPEDQKVLLQVFAKLARKHDGLGMIIAPHEPTTEHLQELEDELKRKDLAHVRLSRISESAKVRVVVVDSVGALFKLYRRGDLAFVGGSFKGSVHSVMEPAGMGLPVAVGPFYRNSQEAILMQERSALQSAKDEAELLEILDSWITNPETASQAGHQALEVVKENAGATERTLKLIYSI